jgi:hypothetical protein
MEWSCSSIVGETLTVKLANQLRQQVVDKCKVHNAFGPAELTINCTNHLIDVTKDQTSIPIGRPLPNYQCLILDEFSQAVIVGQEGELHVAGVGVFAGYLGRDDLTEKTLVQINSQMFYRTGDFVQFDTNGLLYYKARRDHQAKLRGQRIELGEIEQCLLNTSSHVTGCVVIKWNDDHLVAYVQSSDVNEDKLRDHCRSRLPPFMVPSLFIVLERFPLTLNGKLDRKRLPTPDFSALGSASGTVNDQPIIEPSTELETRVHLMWCEVLHRNRISTNTSIYNIGGHSLVLMQLYHRYNSMVEFDTSCLSITQLFQYPSIADHARLIAHSANNKKPCESRWLPLKLTEGKSLEQY